MKNDYPKRKLTRLNGYDYSTASAYFITICTKDRKHLLGTIKNEQMHFTEIGLISEQEIKKIESYYQNVKINKYVVMPNHIHMIIVISNAERINPFPTTKTIKYDLSNIVGKFKAGVTRIVGNAFMHSAKGSIWQTSYHDHIIRGEKDYLKIWEYIDTNVSRWEKDCFFTDEKR